MRLLTTLAALALLLAGTAQAETSPLPADAPLATRPRFWTALGEVTAINGGVWLVDRYLRDKEWARISLDSMGRNLRGGFIWDSDEFGTNQFAHPYHGNNYYNAARDNGFGYVGASLFTLLGSLQWELLAETEPPSINDLINTSLGGIAVGEVLYRLSSQVLDDRATGLARFGHELSAALLSPSRGFNRLVHGDSWRVDATAREELPERLTILGQTGYLKLADGQALTQGSDQLFAQLSLRYGDPVYGDLRRPFDAFSFVAQFTTKEHNLVSYAQVRGVLASTPLLQTEHSRLMLGALQHFDYTNVQAYEVGGQSFGGSLLYGRALSEHEKLRAALHLKGLVLWGISSEHSRRTGRSYDYGPGLDLRFEASYVHHEWEIATAEVGTAWIHTLNGSATNHLFHAGKVQVDLPVYRSLGMGMGVILFQRNSLYRDSPDTTQHISQLRVFISLH